MSLFWLSFCFAGILFSAELFVSQQGDSSSSSSSLLSFVILLLLLLSSLFQNVSKRRAFSFPTESVRVESDPPPDCNGLKCSFGTQFCTICCNGQGSKQGLRMNVNDIELEEQIIQHLAVAAVMRRADQLGRRAGRQANSSPRGHPHSLVLSNIAPAEEENDQTRIPNKSASTPIKSKRNGALQQMLRVRTQSSSSASGSSICSNDRSTVFTKNGSKKRIQKQDLMEQERKFTPKSPRRRKQDTISAQASRLGAAKRALGRDHMRELRAQARPRGRPGATICASSAPGREKEGARARPSARASRLGATEEGRPGANSADMEP
ncbi:uncharacterized protein HKW66_Vig0137190 [Vigna angularis]|uniref:Uncharacterized protein n=1 Tax=Phaseolus angularis TaxID=3914 RepID=A0A8T0KJ79_PHAAN|nr:uncharacterized protein HKW66_Vig0137190 [Vigna angularis]